MIRSADALERPESVVASCVIQANGFGRDIFATFIDVAFAVDSIVPLEKKTEITKLFTVYIDC